MCLCSLEESKCLEQHGIHWHFWVNYPLKEATPSQDRGNIDMQKLQNPFDSHYFLWWLWWNTKRLGTNIQLSPPPPPPQIWTKTSWTYRGFLFYEVSVFKCSPTAVDSTGKQINSQQGQSNSCLKYNVLDYINEVGRVLTSSEACLILCTIPSCPRYWRDSQRGKARSFSTGWLEVRPAARDCPSRQGG